MESLSIDSINRDSINSLLTESTNGDPSGVFITRDSISSLIV